MNCNTMRYRGAVEPAKPLWLALEMSLVEIDRHPVFAAWEIDELDIDVDAPTPYEQMIAGLI